MYVYRYVVLVQNHTTSQSRYLIPMYVYVGRGYFKNWFSTEDTHIHIKPCM
jgi:hypothetical protein